MGKTFLREFPERRASRQIVFFIFSAPSRFYERFGSAIERRTDRDERGAPYPLLYLKLRRLSWERVASTNARAENVETEFAKPRFGVFL